MTGHFVGGLTETVTTDSRGDYTLGLIPNGAFTVTLPSSGSGGLPGSETLVVNALRKHSDAARSGEHVAPGGRHGDRRRRLRL